MPQPKNYNATMAGKVAIVTGAGAEGDGIGIGRAIAVVLAGEGAKVCLVDLDAQRAQDTLNQIESMGAEAFVISANVTLRDDCARIVEETMRRYGRLDVLVNNVGVATPVALEADDEEAWTRVLNINLTSAMLMSRYSVPAMTQNGGGSIINISSIAGIRAHGSIAYGPSKAAMAALARELTVLYGRQGIRANTVAPGHVLTPLAMSLLPEQMRVKRRNVGPLGIEGDGWDVALAVRFLASDEARFITGVHLPVDGGVTEIGPLSAHALIEAGAAQ
ncbi:MULTISPECIES: SDR family NAD(P)-dependent oxidoreductase [unclassified Pseudomonas]|jgi:NAD(P)-dependent dehydrogenase (short-subunit alcohol dehydrogenase family)|uniref:SDR family NAD(P)-dependent oxidoreductase n=1 Tax=unclassified Pseudomonas TaxID=196821 RepID=UPI003132C93E